MDLWIIYLKKLRVAFFEKSVSVDMSYQNINWERDKKFFEIFQLKKDYEMKNEKINEPGLVEENMEEHMAWPDFFNMTESDNNEQDKPGEPVQDENLELNETSEKSADESEEEDDKSSLDKDELIINKKIIVCNFVI